MFDFLRVRSKKDLPPFKDLGKFQQRTRVIAVVLQAQIVSSSYILSKEYHCKYRIDIVINKYG